MKSTVVASPPDILRPADELLRAGWDGVESVSTWHLWRDGAWSIQVEVKLEVQSITDFPQMSVWHLVIDSTDFAETIKLYPDRQSGVRLTFPHQAAVGSLVVDRPWSKGHPCLTVPTAALGRHVIAYEPSLLAERIVWHIKRFAEWCYATALNEHLASDTRFELPPLPGKTATARIGFLEDGETFKIWQKISDQYGLATLVRVAKNDNLSAVLAWQTAQGLPLFSIPWGAGVRNGDAIVPTCIWVRLSEVPLLAAWQLPRTYSELAEVLAAEEFSLEDLFEKLGIELRRKNTSADPSLMIGFPVANHNGELAERLHWVALGSIPLSRRMQVRSGFRANEANRRVWDRQLASSCRPLNWVKCENWASDQLRNRGKSDQFSGLKYLLIGAGALGSTLAETLVRMGAKDVTIADPDTMEVGNLCRHSLDMSAIGQGKAQALAARLSVLEPDVNAIAMPISFPSHDDPGQHKAAEYDVIIDCTGEDAVLRGIGELNFDREILFVSLSMTWGASGMIAYSSTGSIFPSIDATERINRFVRDVESGAAAEVFEGVGCWHPVFPADAADVILWASCGARFIKDSLNIARDACSYFSLQQDGTINRHEG